MVNTKCPINIEQTFFFWKNGAKNGLQREEENLIKDNEEIKEQGQQQVSLEKSNKNNTCPFVLVTKEKKSISNPGKFMALL